MSAKTILLGVFLAALSVSAAVGVAAEPPKNVIFLIGDGMGFEHVKASSMYAYGQDGMLFMESLPYAGQLMTRSANNSVTDSAAAATAIATGVKVNNDVISMAYPGNGSELYTVLEHFRDTGRSTGLVTTTYVTHATPAAFGAHEPSRNNTSNIAGDYLNQTRPNVLLGGGGYGMSSTSATAAGYTVVTSAAGLAAVDTAATTMLSGQFGSGDLPYEVDGLGSLPRLSQMTTTALSMLAKDNDGFFLMVEGGKIDKAAHDNNLNRMIGETLEFDRCVKLVHDWAADRDDTLIVVLADHETGGLKVTQNNGIGVLPSVTWSSKNHTGVDVPVYAWGVNAHLVSGVMDNTEMFDLATTPEPATMTLLAPCLLMLRRRRCA